MIVGATIYLGAVAFGLGLLAWGGLLNGALWQVVTRSGADGAVTSVTVDPSAAVRNVAIAIAGAIGLLLAGWRTITAHRQAETANRQAETANRQLELATRGDIAGRFQKGVEMLNSELLSVRLAGLTILTNVARQAPADYAQSAAEVAAAFISGDSPSTEPGMTHTATSWTRTDLSKDEYAAFAVISEAFVALRGIGVAPIAVKVTDLLFERRAFRDMAIAHIDFSRSRFLSCDFSRCTIMESIFPEASFRTCSLMECMFVFTDFESVDISGASIWGSTVNYCKFYRVILNAANIEDSTFVQSTFDDVNVGGSSWTKCDFEDCGTGDRGFVYVSDDPPPALIATELPGAVEVHIGPYG